MAESTVENAEGAAAAAAAANEVDSGRMEMMMTSLFKSFMGFWVNPMPGQDPDHRLNVHAKPGLMTLLDVALYRSVEGQLTATVCSGHALLLAWIDLKQQAQSILNQLSTVIQQHHQQQQQAMMMTAAVGDTTPPPPLQQQRKSLLESFARLCYEAASDAMERMSTDRLAHSANLSDPFVMTTTTTASTNSSSGSNSNSHNYVLSGVGLQGIENGVLDSRKETGRRYPAPQRRKDCWESPRLFCPDHVWAEDAHVTCQRLLRNICKHSYFSSATSSTTTSSTSKHNNNSNNEYFLGHNNSSSNIITNDDDTTAQLEDQIFTLFHLIKEDIPVRLYQFRSAMEADSVVSKRLYLVKCEYRAPFRGFLEAHQSIQRAPGRELIHESLKDFKSSSSSKEDDNSKQDRMDKAQAKLRKVLETPALKEAMALEQKCEEMEVEMARALFPFTELARSLDQRRAYIKLIDNDNDDDDGGGRNNYNKKEKILVLQDYIKRLKYILCRKSGPETSTGIRPLLLDILGVPRGEKTLVGKSATDTSIWETMVKPQGGGSAHDDQPTTTTPPTKNNKHSLQEIISQQMTELIGVLQTFATLCQTKGAFFTDKRAEMEIPNSIVKGCAAFDQELFQCQFHDWHVLVTRQTEICSNPQFEEWAEKIRLAEMEVGVAAASEQSLGIVRQRLEMLEQDRQKRFEVLKKMVEGICAREMNLYVTVVEPEKNQILSLKKTSSLGIFGLPLEMIGEKLPIG